MTCPFWSNAVADIVVVAPTPSDTLEGERSTRDTRVGVTIDADPDGSPPHPTSSATTTSIDAVRRVIGITPRRVERERMCRFMRTYMTRSAPPSRSSTTSPRGSERDAPIQCYPRIRRAVPNPSAGRTTCARAHSRRVRTHA